MNVFNRVAMSLILLVFILLTLMIAFFPGELIRYSSDLLASTEASLGPATRVVMGIVGLVVAAGAFLLLWAEVRPPSRKSVLVVKGAGGTADLSTESVAFRVKRAAESVFGVREAVPTIHSRGSSVDIMVRLLTDPDVDLPKMTDEVMQAVRTETETRMGIPVKSLRVMVRHGRDRGSSALPALPPKSNLEV